MSPPDLCEVIRCAGMEKATQSSLGWEVARCGGSGGRSMLSPLSKPTGCQMLPGLRWLAEATPGTVWAVNFPLNSWIYFGIMGCGKVTGG